MALTAVGADRPGIVAAVTGALVDLGCNLEDSSMSILRGQFAVLLVVDVPSDVGAAGIEEVLAPVAVDLDLVVVARELPMQDVPTGPEPGGEGSLVTFSVHGADRPGIVHRATSALAEAGGNVVDLSTRLVGTAEEPAYVMLVSAGFPPGVDADAAAATVSAAVEAFGVSCHAHRTDVDVL